MKKVKLYTDGSSRGNPGPGGYGVILEDIKSGVTKECSEGYKLTTNNRMELMAVIAGLEKLNVSPVDVEIITDSRYCLLYTSPSPRDRRLSRMPSSA